MDIELSIFGALATTASPHLNDGLTAFEHAANYGMFVGSQGDPRSSTMDVLTSQDRADLIRRRYRGSAMALGSTRVLLNVVVASCGGSRDAVFVKVEPEDGPALSHDRLAVLPYPRTEAGRHFTVDDRLKEPTSREVFVRVTFRDEMSPQVWRQLNDVFETWRMLVSCGGFPGPYGLDELGTLKLAELYELSPSAAECAVYGYIGPVAAYAPLLNALLKIHLATASIDHVELDG